jgi:hypothetical protein
MMRTCEDEIQIYMMVTSTGMAALACAAEKIKDTPEEQQTGQPVEGVTLYKVEPGDWIVIPSMTWHQTEPHPDQTFVYGMCHIETRNTRA